MFDLSSWSPESVVMVTLMVVFVLVIAVVGAMCTQAGLFYTIHIKTQKPEFGELVVLYKCGRGAYSESGAMFTACHSLMPQYNTIGVYYDDPVKKSSENLRYIVGLVLGEGGSSVNSEDEATLLEHGYRKAVFPAVKHAVVTDFPYHSTLSCIFAVFRVYPALREYVERRELCAHPILELYDNSSKRILFTGPLELQDSFYVPEVLQEDEEADVSSGGGPGTTSQEDDDEDDNDEDESGTESCSVRGGPASVREEEEATGSVAWEQSASLLQDEGFGVGGNDCNIHPGAASAEESETNTTSSFEEIDPSEAVMMPVTNDTPEPAVDSSAAAPITDADDHDTSATTDETIAEAAAADVSSQSHEQQSLQREHKLEESVLGTRVTPAPPVTGDDPVADRR